MARAGSTSPATYVAYRGSYIFACMNPTGRVAGAPCASPRERDLRDGRGDARRDLADVLERRIEAALVQVWSVTSAASVRAAAMNIGSVMRVVPQRMAPSPTPGKM